MIKLQKSLSKIKGKLIVTVFSISLTVILLCYFTLTFQVLLEILPKGVCQVKERKREISTKELSLKERKMIF